MRRVVVLLAALVLLVPALAAAVAACRTPSRCPLAVAMGHDCCAKPQASLRAGCCDPDAQAAARTTAASERVQPSAPPASAQAAFAPALPELADAVDAAARPLATRAAQRSILRI